LISHDRHERGSKRGQQGRAIQHTSVDALPHGRETGARFKKVIGDLEQELAGKLGFPLMMNWDWDAIQKGQQWGAIGDALRSWITSDDACNLPGGRHRIPGAPGVPFGFQVTKGQGLRFDGVRFARHDPGDKTFDARLHDQLAGRHKKLAALRRHRDAGKSTLLLLESGDIALMNAGKIVDGLEAAFPARPTEVDEFWFMHYVAPGTVNLHDLHSGGIWIDDPAAARVGAHNAHGPRLRWTR
jgi:hypothetical protein